MELMGLMAMDKSSHHPALTLSELDNNQLVSAWIPYFIIVTTLLLSYVTCYDLISKYTGGHFFYIFSPRIPSWIIITVGILLLMLCAAAIRLLQVSHQHVQLFNKIKHDFNHEISEHIQAEEIKKKLEITLMEGQKLQAIGTLAGGIAHDFNNILYAINGYVEMVREDVEPNSLIFNNLGHVLEATHRGQELVARILDFGRRNQRYEQKAIEVNTLLENVLGLLKPTIPSGVRINLTGLSNNCVIFGNETQLHQVIVNIINNAVDAMYSEGVLTIEVSTILASNDYLNQFPKVANTNYCKINISDTGYGMDQATLKRIFEPFYTTKEVGKGTGLGLATAHGIIAQHHGEITVTSQLGKGTTFTLLLPEHQEIPTQMEDPHGNYSFSRR
jgi:signal transduction histidine kinase